MKKKTKYGTYYLLWTRNPNQYHGNRNMNSELIIEFKSIFLDGGSKFSNINKQKSNKLTFKAAYNIVYFQCDKQGHKSLQCQKRGNKAKNRERIF